MWSIFEQSWEQQDVVVIGGGTSLRNFDFTLLAGCNTIGVNDAFRLGPAICKVCIFGDATWWHKVKFDLNQYVEQGGYVYSVSPSLEGFNIPNIRKLGRIQHGLGTGGMLAWNYNTGAAAVNLAYSLGASRIFLLGFDMSSGPGKATHWHGYSYRHNQNSETYARFLRGFDSLANALKKHPEVQVFNVTDGTSKLPHFERINFQEFEQLMRNEPNC